MRINWSNTQLSSKDIAWVKRQVAKCESAVQLILSELKQSDHKSSNSNLSVVMLKTFITGCVDVENV